jgi:hypothetical protein
MTRFRDYLIENETILDQVSSKEGVSALQKGHPFTRQYRKDNGWLSSLSCASISHANVDLKVAEPS